MYENEVTVMPLSGFHLIFKVCCLLVVYLFIICCDHLFFSFHLLLIIFAFVFFSCCHFLHHKFFKVFLASLSRSYLGKNCKFRWIGHLLRCYVCSFVPIYSDIARYPCWYFMFIGSVVNISNIIGYCIIILMILNTLYFNKYIWIMGGGRFVVQYA